MALTKQTVHFEVYTLRSGSWELYARYLEKERKAAIQDAQKLEKTPGIEGAKVVRDTYDLATGASTEQTVFKSYQMKQDFVGVRVSESATAESRKSNAATRSDTKQPRKEIGIPLRTDPTIVESKPPSAGGTLTLATLTSLISGAASAGLVGFVANQFDLSFKPLGSYGEPAALASAFLCGFVACFAFVIHKRLSDDEPTIVVARLPNEDAMARLASGAQPETPPEPAIHFDTESNQTTTPPIEPPDENIAVKTATDAASAQLEKFSAYAEKQLGLATRFVSESTKDFDTDRTGKSADSVFRAFGVNLFMAGACTTLAERRTLDYPAMIRILRESVELTGRSRKQADHFVDTFEEDLLADSRNAHPFEDGQTAMVAFLDGDAAAPKLLAQTITQWMSPNAHRGGSAPVTIVFVDVEIPEQSDESDDKVISENAIHTRNRLVHDVLDQYEGTEIRHTGPGIMASFPTTSRGLEAAVVIQRKSAAHNQIQPDLPVRLKIGVNTGDPEDEDPFLANTAALAAWACTSAAFEQIVLSETVRTVCADGGFVFQDLGVFEHKGSGKSIPLFEAVWKTPGYLKDIRSA